MTVQDNLYTPAVGRIRQLTNPPHGTRIRCKKCTQLKRENAKLRAALADFNPDHPYVKESK